MPHVLGLLVGFVDGKEGCGARVGVDGDLPVRLEVRVEGALPARLAAAPFRIEPAQLGHTSLRGQPHALEQRVAHEHGQAATVVHHDVARRRRRDVHGRARALPLVHEARVHRAHHEAEPRDDVR